MILLADSEGPDQSGTDFVYSHRTHEWFLKWKVKTSIMLLFQARDAYLLGNIAEGQIYQEKARRFIIISLFVGIIIHAASITILLILLA